MDWFVKSFLKSAVAWLLLGGLAGLAMAARPEWTVYRAAHAHMLLLGFVAMMIFGVGYHVIPRFVGSPIRDRRAPTAHWWLANVGLLLMVVGFILRAAGSVRSGTWALVSGGTLSGSGIMIFAYVIWTTLDRPLPGRRARPISEAPPLKSRGLPMAGGDE
jgi:cbb3-type cytochrome oxidase subunit 1